MSPVRRRKPSAAAAEAAAAADVPDKSPSSRSRRLYSPSGNFSDGFSESEDDDWMSVSTVSSRRQQRKISLKSVTNGAISKNLKTAMPKLRAPMNRVHFEDTSSNIRKHNGKVKLQAVGKFIGNRKFAASEFNQTLKKQFLPRSKVMAVTALRKYSKRDRIVEETEKKESLDKMKQMGKVKIQAVGKFIGSKKSSVKMESESPKQNKNKFPKSKILAVTTLAVHKKVEKKELLEDDQIKEVTPELVSNENKNKVFATKKLLAVSAFTSKKLNAEEDIVVSTTDREVDSNFEENPEGKLTVDPGDVNTNNTNVDDDESRSKRVFPTEKVLAVAAFSTKKNFFREEEAVSVERKEIIKVNTNEVSGETNDEKNFTDKILIKTESEIKNGNMNNFQTKEYVENKKDQTLGANKKITTELANKYVLRRNIRNIGTQTEKKRSWYFCFPCCCR